MICFSITLTNMRFVKYSWIVKYQIVSNFLDQNSFPYKLFVRPDFCYLSAILRFPLHSSVHRRSEAREGVGGSRWGSQQLLSGRAPSSSRLPAAALWVCPWCLPTTVVCPSARPRQLTFLESGPANRVITFASLTHRQSHSDASTMWGIPSCIDYRSIAFWSWLLTTSVAMYVIKPQSRTYL